MTRGQESSVVDRVPGEYRLFEVAPIAGALGAEIRGVDLASDLDDEVVAEIRRAWLEYHVVVFRKQPLGADDYLAFARRIGDPIEYPFVPGLPDHPVITEVSKLERERVNFGGIWHSDTTYLAEPPMATMLLAREVPPVGGDTLYANCHLAYDTLSDGMKKMLDDLDGVSSSALADVSKTREDRIRESGADTDDREFVACHPVVRVHPETGRPSLYVNVAHTVRFASMTEEESAPILRYLFEHQVRPEHTCRVRWDVGTLVMWDNRSVLHNPVNDYHGHRRVMHRITLASHQPS